MVVYNAGTMRKDSIAKDLKKLLLKPGKAKVMLSK